MGQPSTGATVLALALGEGLPVGAVFGVAAEAGAAARGGLHHLGVFVALHAVDLAVLAHQRDPAALGVIEEEIGGRQLLGHARRMALGAGLPQILAGEAVGIFVAIIAVGRHVDEGGATGLELALVTGRASDLLVLAGEIRSPSVGA